MKTLEVIGKTIELAVEDGVKELSTNIENIEYEVIQEPKKGFLGFIGSKPAKIKIWIREESIDNATRVTGTRSKRATNENRGHDSYEILARQFLEEILDDMSIECEIHVENTKDLLKVNLVGNDMGILIGRRGETLDSLQYLLSLVINKEHKDLRYKRVILDTENYRKKREETLIRLANKLANKVKKTGKNVILEPMNPYERRVIHSALQGNKNISTRSEGDEPYRKVVILPKN